MPVWAVIIRGMLLDFSGLFCLRNDLKGFKIIHEVYATFLQIRQTKFFSILNENSIDYDQKDYFTPANFETTMNIRKERYY